MSPGTAHSALRFSVIDEALRDHAGHAASYDLPIYEELQRQGVSCHVFGNRHLTASVAERGSIRPVFDTVETRRATSVPALATVLHLTSLLLANFLHLYALIVRVTPALCDEEVVLITRPTSGSRLAYSLWALYLTVQRRHVTFVMVVHNVPHRVFRWEIRLLRLCARRHRLVFVAHTRAIAQQSQHHTGVPCAVVPLPFQSPMVDKATPQGEVSDPTFAYLGLAHRAKGLDTLMGAISLLQQDETRDARIRFTIQCYVYGSDADAIDLVETMRDKAQGWKSVTLIERSLTTEEYRQTMLCADAILVPNKKKYYEFALGGVFTEALAIGKPVIVSRETLMADVLAEYGAGVTFVSGDSSSLAAAIRELHSSLPQLSRSAMERADDWVAIHNPSSFVHHLLTVIEDKQ